MEDKILYIAPHLGKDENGNPKWLTDEFDLYENKQDAINVLKQIEKEFKVEFKNKKIYKYGTAWIDDDYLKTEWQTCQTGYVYFNTYIVFKVHKQSNKKHWSQIKRIKK